MGGSWAKRPVLKNTSCNRSTTGLFDFWQTGQLATGLITIDHNWQLQSNCNQLQSSPVASLCTSCQLDFETLCGGGVMYRLDNGLLLVWGNIHVTFKV